MVMAADDESWGISEIFVFCVFFLSVFDEKEHSYLRSRQIKNTGIVRLV